MNKNFIRNAVLGLAATIMFATVAAPTPDMGFRRTPEQGPGVLAGPHRPAPEISPKHELKVESPWTSKKPIQMEAFGIKKNPESAPNVQATFRKPAPEKAPVVEANYIKRALEQAPNVQATFRRPAPEKAPIV